MKPTKVFLLMVGVGLAAAGCGSGEDPVVCGDGGCVDASASMDAGGVPYIPMTGRYRVTDYNPVNDGCMIGVDRLKNSTDPLDWIMVRVEGGMIKVGNDRGTPAMPSLGEGRLDSAKPVLMRANHVKNPDPSTCEYDSMVLAEVSLDDPASKTIGLSVREQQSNRTMCTDPVGVGASCTSTWSWRLTPTGM
jgi:hypothetical protein